MEDNQIEWAGRTLQGTDRFGRWVTTGLDGWWDSPDVRGETEDRVNEDGEYDLPIHNMARYITATGAVHTTGHDQLHEAGNYLMGPMSGRFQVAGHSDILWADTKRNGGIKFTPITDRYAQWQVRLKAVDPRKYGDANITTMAAGATVSGFHRGNYPALPKFVVTGAMAGGYTLTVNGWNYQVTVPLVAGSPHTIDYRDGRLRIGGVIMQNSLGNTNLASIPPGASVGVGLFPTSGGSGSAVMTILDTYI